MTTLKRVVLNGVTLTPTEIDQEDVRIAKGPERMLDGTLRMWHRAFKRKWTLTWSSLHEDNVPAIRTLYRTTSSITYNDQDNANYTVVTTSKTENLSAERISRPGAMYFDVELTIEEV
jgi:hypothetical protein